MCKSALNPNPPPPAPYPFPPFHTPPLPLHHHIHPSRYPQPRHLPHLLLPPSCFPSAANHVTDLPSHPHPQSRPLPNAQKPNILLDPLPLARRQNPATLRLKPQLYGPR